ncbi:GntR family transcriptional regulator [bacterium D16-54]|nr:GntR family transcriptional regulator [bacterium D16-54]RKJ16591.1 GntR family transcriptional regulator [bacterium D16-56]
MDKLDTNRGAPPLYLQISQILRRKIVSKDYLYNEIIPSETELQKMYNVSRITARQAIQELEKDGMVKRSRGVGTVVVYQERIEEYLSQIKSFTDEMKDRGIVPSTSYAHIELAEADEKLASLFGVEAGAKLYRLERVRNGDGNPIVLFVSYFALECEFILNDSLYFGSVYETLQEKGFMPEYVEECFDCMMPEGWVREHLNISKTMPVLRRIRRSYMENGRMLEYTMSYYRSDRYAYYVTLRKT